MSVNHKFRMHELIVTSTYVAAVLAVAGGSLNDIYDHVERGYAFPIYAGAGFIGPMAAPIIGLSISQFWDWRWNYYLNGIVGCAMTVFLCVLCPETLQDIILFDKAKRMWKQYREQDLAGLTIRKPLRKKTPPGEFLRIILLKALAMLVHEPLIIYLTALLSLAYFVFFGFLEALPVIYGDIHGLELYQVGLCFIPIFIGAGIATILALPMARAYEKEARSGIMPPPERRLIPLIVGGFVLPISLFWQGWAGYKSSSEQD
jgi:DHA1 family multidrug resistance protein-like MFS transporter